MKDFLLNITHISHKKLVSTINASLLPNICEFLFDKNAENKVNISLTLERVDKFSICIKGTIHLCATFQCTRCQNELPIDHFSEMDIVLTKNASTSDDKALVVDKDIFNLLELIDEDLLAELPFNPSHEECKLPLDK